MKVETEPVVVMGQRESWASFARGLSVPGVLAGLGVPFFQFMRGRAIAPSLDAAFNLAMVTALFGAALAPLCTVAAIFIAIFTCVPTWAEAWRFRRTWRDVLLGILGTIVAWACLLPEMMRD